jgi:hypothetical protein
MAQNGSLTCWPEDEGRCAADVLAWFAAECRISSSTPEEAFTQALRYASFTMQGVSIAHFGRYRVLTHDDASPPADVRSETRVFYGATEAHLEQVETARPIVLISNGSQDVHHNDFRVVRKLMTY